MKSFKLKPVINTIVLFLTLLFAFLAGTSTLELSRKTLLFNYETEDLRKTPVFTENLNNDLLSIAKIAYRLNYYGQNMSFEDFLKNSSLVETERNKYENELNTALYYYNQIIEIKKNEPLADGTFYDENMDMFYDDAGNEFSTVDSLRGFYQNNSDSTAPTENTTATIETQAESATSVEISLSETIEIPQTFSCHAEWEYVYNNLRYYLFNIVNDARSEETIKQELQTKYEEGLKEQYYQITSEINFHRSEFFNIDFLIINNSNGNYISSFENKSDIEKFKSDFKKDAYFYFYLNDDTIDSTSIKPEFKKGTLNYALEEFGVINDGLNFTLLRDYLDGSTVFVRINQPKTENDEYFTLLQLLIESKNTIYSELRFKTFFFTLLSLLGIIYLSFFTVNKNTTQKLKLRYRLPFIFKLVIYLLAFVISLGGIIGLIALEYLSESVIDSGLFNLVNTQTGPHFAGLLALIFTLSTIGFIKYLVINKKSDLFKERFFTYKIHHRIKSAINNSKSIRKSFKQIEKKLLLVITAWFIVELILLILIFHSLERVYEIEGLILSILFTIILFTGLFFVIKFLSDIKTLANAVEQMKNGDLNINLQPQKFIFPLKDFAFNLNQCRDSIENAVKDAIKGEKLKTELITNVSHDLKTPLTSIINYISLLKLCDIQGENENKYLEIIDEKSNKLQRLIEDLTEASKASSGNIKMNPEVVSLNELSLQAVGENNDVLENAGFDIVLTQKNDDLFVMADSKRTFRIFDNLFSNVKKYALPGTRIYVDVYKDGTYGVFSIKNISKDKLNISADEITERFVRGDNSRTSEGSGLGLSIARSFTELQGGIFLIEIDGDLFKVSVKLPSASKPTKNKDSDAQNEKEPIE